MPVVYIVRSYPSMIPVGSVRASDAEEAERLWEEDQRRNAGARPAVLATRMTPERWARGEVHGWFQPSAI